MKILKIDEMMTSIRNSKMLNENKLIDSIKRYHSDKMDAINSLCDGDYSLTIEGLIAMYRYFYSNDIDFFTDFLDYTFDTDDNWLNDEYEWWHFVKLYIAFRLLDDVSIEDVIQAIIDEEYTDYMSDPDNIFEDFRRNETGEWVEGICTELGIQTPDMDD